MCRKQKWSLFSSHILKGSYFTHKMCFIGFLVERWCSQLQFHITNQWKGVYVLATPKLRYLYFISWFIFGGAQPAVKWDVLIFWLYRKSQIMWVKSKKKSKSKIARAVIASKLTAPPYRRYRGTRFASYVVTCNITDTNQHITPTWNL